MKFLIHETNFCGNHISPSGEIISGATAVSIIEQMKKDPFNIDKTPIEYAHSVLKRLDADTALPQEPEEASKVFLEILCRLGYVTNLEQPSAPANQ